jgi:hypothetical protein
MQENPKRIMSARSRSECGLAWWCKVMMALFPPRLYRAGLISRFRLVSRLRQFQFFMSMRAMLDLALSSFYIKGGENPCLSF